MVDRTRGTLLTILAATVLAVPLAADPCGMVPPPYVAEGPPIVRIGAQRTYVFFKDGVETVVIRPGFSGKVDEFGMLIPFPSVPALRKIPDETFAHIAAAIDPPEVVVNIGLGGGLGGGGGGGGLGGGGGGGQRALSFEIEKEEVKVLKEEAVGMYEVAVLAAGSAKALNRWIDEHGYRYPKGMDEACEDYVKDRWCFVAVRARVGSKRAVDPKPGMRKVDPALPPGANFDGYVQGMGFRFAVDELVVPMRLSAFNEGKLRNIVYLLTDKPSRARSLPTKFVVRQLTGDRLYRNLVGPLPVRVYGGGVAKIPRQQAASIRRQRDPGPHVQAARELFASDLLALKEKRLTHPHEEKEKELLRVNEALGLRGPEIDAITYEVLERERKRALVAALRDVRKMSLTVIDGEFSRETLAADNLYFSEYAMKPARNSSRFYDAKRAGPGRSPGGRLIAGAFDLRTEAAKLADREAPKPSSRRASILFALGALMVSALFLAKASRRWTGKLLLVALLTALGGVAVAEDVSTIDDSIHDLADREKSAAAVEALVSKGEAAVPALVAQATAGSELGARGWSIVCLGRIGGKQADHYLADLHDDADEQPLIRAWALAARLRMVESKDELLRLTDLIDSVPAVAKPLVDRYRAIHPGSLAPLAESLLERPAATQANDLRKSVLALGVDPLLAAMLTAEKTETRRQAASFLAALAQRKGQAEVVARALNEALALQPGAEQTPWENGPLFLPSIEQNKGNARRMIGNLISWRLWCEGKDRSSTKQQIMNSLNSFQLLNDAGVANLANRVSVGVDDLLLIWGRAVGKDEIRRMLDEQNLTKQYAEILERL